MNLESPDPATLLRVAAIGAGATLVLDAWLLVLRSLRLPTMNFVLLGRWLAHLLRGTFRHASIAKAPPVRGELALGWIAHYGVGIFFAGVLVTACALQGVRAPSLAAALAFGVLTVAVPFFAMQPSMGLGIASSRTPAPLANRLRSVANHAVFGLGLYLAAAFIESISR